MKPPQSVLEAYGISSSTSLKHLKGGQGTTYQAENIILKPVANSVEAHWIAEVYRTIKPVGFRVPRPVATNSGEWVFENWSAWTFVKGETILGKRYEERLQTSRAFHAALADIPKPAFFDTRADPWAQADRIVWENADWQPHPRVSKVYTQLANYTETLNLSEQIIHGDIAGNMLYAPDQDLAVIDFSPYWRPGAYAEALLFVDSVMWEGADWSIINLLKPGRNTFQLILRAAMRRLAEVNQHYLVHKKSNYLNQVDKYEIFLRNLQRALT